MDDMNVLQTFVAPALFGIGAYFFLRFIALRLRIKFVCMEAQSTMRARSKKQLLHSVTQAYKPIFGRARVLVAINIADKFFANALTCALLGLGVQYELVWLAVLGVACLCYRCILPEQEEQDLTVQSIRLP